MPPHNSNLGNPAPLGLLAFGMTTMMLMYVDMQWVESDFAQMVIGYGFFYGGLCQVLVAIFELQKGSSFSFAVFGSYGAFWLGWALVALENENIVDTPNFVGGYNKGQAAYMAQVRFDVFHALCLNCCCCCCLCCHQSR